MAARRASRRPAQRKQSKASLFSTISNCLLFALVILAAAGWYTTNHSDELSNPFQENKSKQLAANSVVKPEFKTIKREFAANDTDTINKRTTAPIPQSAPIPNNPTVLDVIKTASIAPTIKLSHGGTNMEDEKLPPVSHFNPANGANAIFTVKKTIIYQDANTSSKQIAVISAGRELRSYDEHDGWHRVVVPSSAIIGWAKADTLKIPHH